MPMIINELWPGGPLFKEEPGLFRVGADSVLLAHFAGSTRMKNKKQAIDLGCGTGIIPVLLALADQNLHVDGIELQAKAARLAVENAQQCGLADRVTIIEGDIRNHRELLRRGAYDLVLSNPPYNKQGSGKRPDNPGLATARDDEMCTLDDLCQTAGYLTRRGGAFLLVHKPGRLADIFRAMTKNSLEPKRLRYVQHKITTPPTLVLIESRRDGNPSLKTEAPLILKNENGTETEEVKAMYRRDRK